MQKFTNLLLSVAVAASSAFALNAAVPTAKKAGAFKAQTVEMKAKAVSKQQQRPYIKSPLLEELTSRKHSSLSPFAQAAAKKAATYKPKQTSHKTPLMAEGTMPSIEGMVVYSDNWDEPEIGWYTVPTSSAQDFNMITAIDQNYINTVYCAINTGDVIYTHDYYNLWGLLQIFTIYGFDAESGEMVSEYEGGPEVLAAGVALDPSTNTYYCVNFNEEGSGYNLSTIEYGETPVITTIAEFAYTGGLSTLACTKEGQLYGISGTGDLIKINKTTGEVEVVGPTGYAPKYLSSGAIDPATNRMFYAISPEDETGSLLEIDLETGVASLVYDFPGCEEIMGLYIPVPKDPSTPDVPTDLAPAFLNGALTGNVSFKAPEKNIDGNAGTGELTYVLTMDGEEIATATCAYGETVNKEVTVEASGSYTFAAYVYNDKGTSKKVKETVYIGNATPAAPANVNAVAEGSDITITWDAVTTTTSLGYFEADDVTYTVTRSDGKEVAKNITETTCSDTYVLEGDLAKISYTVVANFGDEVSKPAKSNTLIFGSYSLPFDYNFSEADSLDDFIVIDNNGDGKTWKLATTISTGVKYAECSYNSSMDMDDYLVTPKFTLENDKAYIVKVSVSGKSTYYAERFEVVAGKEASAEALNETVIEPTDILSSTPEDFEAYFSPAESGDYFFAVHGISDADMYNLDVYSISISAPLSADMPAAPEDLTVVAGANFALTAKVTLNAPSKTFGGNDLTALTSVVLSRDGEVIKTFSPVTPGQALTFDDTVEETGDYLYTAYAVNAEGDGIVAKVLAHIGAETPGAIQNVDMVETSTPGEVTITWDPVTTTESGATISADLVTYVITKSDRQTIVAEGVTGTSYTFAACPEDQQTFAYYAVFPKTEAGTGLGAYTPFMAVGTPYTNFYEDFAGGKLTYAWATGEYDGGQWGLYTSTTLQGVDDPEGDDGFAAMKGQYIDAYAMLFTAKVVVPTDAPAVKFETYNIIGENPENLDINKIEVLVSEPNADEWTPVSTTVISEACDNAEGWFTVIVPLTEYAGQTVQIGFKATVQAYAFTMLDDVKVCSLVDNDVAVQSIAAPAYVECGEEYEVKVVVSNEGANTASNVNVNLYADGELVESQPIDEILSGKRENVIFGATMSPVATEAVTYYAEVVYSADEVEENNKSEEITVTPKLNNLPYVTDLEGEADGTEIKLTWSAPAELTGAVTGSTGFEDGEAWAHEYADWTFVDKDGAEVGGFQGTDIPGIEPGETKSSFFIFDGGDEAVLGNYAASFAAHDGDKYLACLFNYDDSPVDDWALSPVLSGNAQTLTFWAKNYSTQYKDGFNVLYCTTLSVNPDDYVALTQQTVVPGGEWTEYTYELPAGALRFAIQSCMGGGFMLMLDDFTFEAGEITYEVEGYNVYCDGVKVNEELVTATEYTTTGEPESKYSYAVTTVLKDFGESRASNVVEVETESGLNGLTKAFSVVATDGVIVINGAEGKEVTVNAVDGKVVYTASKAAATVKVPVAQGVYVVKAGKKVVKVIVK